MCIYPHTMSICRVCFVLSCRFHGSMHSGLKMQPQKQIQIPKCENTEIRGTKSVCAPKPKQKPKPKPQPDPVIAPDMVPDPRFPIPDVR